MSDTLTRGVRIRVRPEYLSEQSDATQSRYWFAYHIAIRNEGDETVQLLSRHWVITHGDGRIDGTR